MMYFDYMYHFLLMLLQESSALMNHVRQHKKKKNIAKIIIFCVAGFIVIFIIKIHEIVRGAHFYFF